jgi:3-oxoacyl-(acyl-carrier-protein) synthase
VITAVAARTAAGDVHDLVALLRSGGNAASVDAPYPTEGLKPGRGAWVSGLDRSQPARTLLQDVVGQVLQGRTLERVGLVVGTSSGDISGPWERWHRAQLQGEDAGPEPGRHDPTVHVAERFGLAPACTVSVACASGTAGLAVAQGWLRDGRCDAVVVAGVDALSVYVHAGFSGLGALSQSHPSPFSATRDGLVLGEGAAALLLEPQGQGLELHGTGLAADAVHMTAPHREGRGAAHAMAAALGAHPPSVVDSVSVHATGTRFNDGMESHALAALFGEQVPHFWGAKHAIGHTLGAAGAIETAVLAACGDLPPPYADLDPALPARPAPVAATPGVFLSTNSAFGGANAAALFARPGHLHTPAPQRRDVHAGACVSVTLPPGKLDATVWLDAPDRFRRMNRYVRAGVLATRALLEHTGPLPQTTGMVLASRSNCRGADVRYHRRLVQRGAAHAPRVEFIYTVPGAPTGEASILWNLQGPSLTVLGGWDDAVDHATNLLRWGHGARLIALHIEAPSRTEPAVARAQLLSV